jgi:hypothetical protein
MARVEEVLGAFGEAVVAAQGQIRRAARERSAPIDGARVTFSITETELELKLVFEETGGPMAIRPVAVGASRLQRLDPGVLSTLRAKLLVVPDEDAPTPRTSSDKIRDDVLKRPDVQRLQRIFEGLTVVANYVPAVQRWLVDIAAPGGLTLRSLQIDD